MRFVARWPHECVMEIIGDDINGTIPRGRTSEPHFFDGSISMLPIVTDGYLLLPFGKRSVLAERANLLP